MHVRAGGPEIPREEESTVLLDLPTLGYRPRGSSPAPVAVEREKAGTTAAAKEEEKVVVPIITPPMLPGLGAVISEESVELCWMAIGERKTLELHAHECNANEIGAALLNMARERKLALLGLVLQKQSQARETRHVQRCEGTQMTLVDESVQPYKDITAEFTCRARR